MDVATVETQKADAMNVLSTQFGVQEKMLDHQHETQLKVLEAEKTRMVAQMTTQYDQQYMTQKLAIEQAYKQQHSQLSMAKTQREMAIQQQAAQMTSQAKQYEMAVEMQKQMASAYGSAFAGAGAAAKGG